MTFSAKNIGLYLMLISAAAGFALWIDSRYYHAEAADRHERSDSFSTAQVLYQLARQETLILRNRVNDCESKTSGAPETVACKDYKREYVESKRRTEILFEQLQKGSR